MSIRTRQDQLLELVAVFPLQIKALSSMLKVSERKVRYDVDYLVSRNKLFINPDVTGGWVTTV